MLPQLFVNLPVENLERTKSFFSALGYSFNQMFTSEEAACMVISKDISVMLLTKPFFKKFAPQEISDAKKAIETILCLSAESREEVDALVKKAIDAGATENAHKENNDFMYLKSFCDLDGHTWEVAYMDVSAFPSA